MCKFYYIQIHICDTEFDPHICMKMNVTVVHEKYMYVLLEIYSCFLILYNLISKSNTKIEPLVLTSMPHIMFIFSGS